MTKNPGNDFKKNISDLTKIPPNEFEKYFHDWMERDDVARSLQAKLRCDLIRNFNKTNLGKHILSHTMTSTGGSNMRLTLSPLVLALNTLVAEFLYAQNCHFTLSVFCTEIPFRNTLPDFESMRHFRFNNTEIEEIWKAVTGYSANKNDLNKYVILNYESDQSLSLLLLIIKYLLKKDLSEQLNKSVEVQTEVQERYDKSTIVQASDQEKKLSSKSTPKSEDLRHINKYLQTLSEKVSEMTKEFEQFAKQSHVSRSRILRSARSREYYTLNKSLERITENMKIMAQTKRKNKRLSNIVESLDGLTKEFGKCALNFDNVIKILGSKENKSTKDRLKSVKVKLKEKQTETEMQEKSYAEWIHEMRNTLNGQRFLNRVEISLRKALTKHSEQLQNEMDIKLKHMKSLMKLHYQQKLSKHLLQDPKFNLEETRKYNDIIGKKLQEFELKQKELLQKFQESPLDLREIQLQQKEGSIQTDEKDKNIVNNTLKGDVLQREAQLQHKDISLQREEEYYNKNSRLQLKEVKIRKESVEERHKPENAELHMQSKDEVGINADFHKVTESDIDTRKTFDIPKSILKDTKQQFLDMAKTIAEQNRSVDNIIYDAKLRIQQLENESNQLEQTFQSYLERRKRNQELEALEILTESPKENLSTITSLRRQLVKPKLASFREEMDYEFDEEFRRMKENLQLDQEQNEQQKSGKSNSTNSSLEMRNAILDAKLKFFKHEHTVRQIEEHNEQLCPGNSLQRQSEKYQDSCELPEYFNNDFENCDSERNINVDVFTADKDTECNLKSNALEHDMDLRPSVENKTQPQIEKSLTTNVRRELFPKEQTIPIEKHNAEYHEPVSMHNKDLKKASNGRLYLSETVYMKPQIQVETNSELIKQSMAKMQQLFEQQSQSKETLREMVHNLEQQRHDNNDLPTELKLHELRSSESLTTTITSTVTNTTSITSSSNEEIQMKYNAKLIENISNLNRISNTSMPSILNLTSESEESVVSVNKEVELTTDTIIETDGDSAKPISLNMYEKLEEGQTKESSESSELDILPSSDKTKEDEFLHKINEEFGEIADSPKLPSLNLCSPDSDKEIGEVFSASSRNFVTIDTKLSESTSTRSSSDLQISIGNQHNDGKHGTDSESDFWI